MADNAPVLIWIAGTDKLCYFFNAGWLKFTGRDEGMGIRAADKDKIFGRHYRVQTSDMERISGFGIGLYLSSEIITGHNGEIGVESEPGKGSTFWFTLPIQ